MHHKNTTARTRATYQQVLLAGFLRHIPNKNHIPVADGRREMCIATIHVLTVVNNQQLFGAPALSRGSSQPCQKAASAISCPSLKLHRDEHSLSELSIGEQTPWKQSLEIKAINPTFISAGFRKSKAQVLFKMLLYQSLALKLKHHEKVRKRHLR